MGSGGPTAIEPNAATLGDIWMVRIPIIHFVWLLGNLQFLSEQLVVEKLEEVRTALPMAS